MRNTLLRRIAPLYGFSFFQGLIFWYAIEKVFMTHIGFKASTIALSVIVMAITSLLLDVPSGIWADRRSRKTALLIAALCLGVSSFLMGVARNVPEYILAGLLFAVYSALHAGVFDSMLYDTLLEETGDRKGYEKYLGYSNMSMSIANVIGSLSGALLGASISLSAPYFFSVPSALLSTLCLTFFREPTLHKAQSEDSSVSLHVKQIIDLVFKKRLLLWALVSVMFTTVVYSFMLEVDQLWPLALHLKTAFYGPLNALLLLGFGLGGSLATIMAKRRFYVFIGCLLGLTMAFGLVIKNIFIVAGAQFGTLCIFVALYTIAIGKLHDASPSKFRSSISSTANMSSSILFVPLVFVFGLIAQARSVFTAAWILLPLALLAVIGELVITRGWTDAHLVSEKPKVMPNPTAPQ